MAFTAAYSFTSPVTTRGGASISFSVPASAGDLLVAVLGVDDVSRDSGAVTVSDVVFPAEWGQPLWLDGAVATGDPRIRYGVASVSSLWVASARTVTGTVTWSMQDKHYAAAKRLFVLRFGSMRQVAAWAVARLNAQTVAFPAVSGVSPVDGHAVALALVSSTPSPASLVPSGFTSRGSADVSPTMGWASLVVSERSLTAAAPTAVSGTARVSGWALQAYVTNRRGPGAPLITVPTGVADLSQAFTIGWTPDGVQSAYGARRRTVAADGTPGAWQYWTGSAWSGSSPTWITSTATTLPVAAGAFTAGGQTWEIGVATKGDADRPDDSDWASTAVASWAAPTATDITVTPRTGSTVTSRVPTLTATGTAGSGSTLTSMDVEVVDATTSAVYAAGSHAPGGSWTLPVAQAIPNNVTVKLRARVVQQGVQGSAWIERGPYTVSVPTPPAPTVTAATVTHPVSGLPGVGLSITAPGAAVVRIWRDGTLLGDWPVTAGALQWQDYTPGTGQAVSYAVASLDAAAPVNISPQTVTAFTVADTGGLQWLVDPFRPEAAVQVSVQEVGDVTHGTRTRAFQPLGSSSWLTRTLGRVDAAGSLTVAVLDADACAAALALLTSGRLLTLWMPRERDGLGGLWSRPPLRFRVAGDVSEAYIVQGSVAWRRLTFDWVAQ